MILVILHRVIELFLNLKTKAVLEAVLDEFPQKQVLGVGFWYKIFIVR